jgi:hypothetical protein
MGHCRQAKATIKHHKHLLERGESWRRDFIDMVSPLSMFTAQANFDVSS